MIPLTVHSTVVWPHGRTVPLSVRFFWTDHFILARSKSEEMILRNILQTLHCSNRSFTVHQKTREIIHLRLLGLLEPVGVYTRCVPQYRGGIFKLLWSPEIDSKDSIPPTYVA
jgi:hypothetical protein